MKKCVWGMYEGTHGRSWSKKKSGAPSAREGVEVVLPQDKACSHLEPIEVFCVLRMKMTINNINTIS